MPGQGQGYIAMNQSATSADLGTQTITVGPALLTGAADGSTTQTALTNLVTDLNSLKAKLRTAGLLKA